MVGINLKSFVWQEKIKSQFLITVGLQTKKEEMLVIEKIK